MPLSAVILKVAFSLSLISVNCCSFTQQKYTEAVASMVATPVDTVKEQILHVHDLHAADAVYQC